ncbi:pectinesterase family protein [Paenarthrobacter aurescens]|nr:pectinesterase family protein [Paenarthrobacter aurescens]MDO6141940.1 right-handed parallel beta-helix repeat-containing protein [Paenarthrobacter aurescens]MDO6145745.1 right-handed parallel beta-helix repeat-containing protein [Paenarthrobacter aurescens]MDO6156989.1 right-handed parallel beta-helix repeat-containing protein [Paenarthrobacter aurescens]MDO6160975.1 right-handed parallel beta-helix repeat-containing protein [Paenarthrobacter aurescens]
MRDAQKLNIRRRSLLTAGLAAGTLASAGLFSPAMAAPATDGAPSGVDPHGWDEAGLPVNRGSGGSWTPAPEGFAGVASHGRDGTTGGAGGRLVHARTPEELRAFAKSPEALVVILHGTLEFIQYEKLTVTSNKSFLGAGAGVAVVNAGFKLVNVANIVFRNFTLRDSYIPGDFVGKRPDNDRDGIQMDTSTHVWVDHMHFTRLGDGLVDIRKDCDNVTLSWNVFSDHNKALGEGWTQNVITRVTLHHNWIRNTHQRNASLDNTAASHVYNNYLENISSYGMLGRNAALLLVEGNYFRDVRNPLHHQGPGGALVARDNVFEDCTGNTGQERGSAFHVPYSYDLTPTKAVPALVRAFGGPLAGTEPALRDVITVALDGTGDFASIRAAVGAIPANNPRAVTVLLQPGIYHEPAVIWGDRRNITLAGATGNAEDVILTNSEGVTLLVAADGSALRDLTVTSDTPQSGHVLLVTGIGVSRTNVAVLNGTSG